MAGWLSLLGENEPTASSRSTYVIIIRLHACNATCFHIYTLQLFLHFNHFN